MKLPSVEVYIYPENQVNITLKVCDRTPYLLLY